MTPMNLLPFLALLEHTGDSIFDEMLRLVGIAAIVIAFFKGIKALVHKPAAAPAPAAIAPLAQRLKPAVPPNSETIPPEILAVIAAAVATVCGSSRRVVAIRSQNPYWEMAGRQSVLTSHRIR